MEDQGDRAIIIKPMRSEHLRFGGDKIGAVVFRLYLYIHTSFLQVIRVIIQ